MTIETDTDADTTSAAEPQDSSTTATDSSDSQIQDTQATEGATETTAPANADSQDDGNGSSTTQDTTVQTADKAANTTPTPAAVDWEAKVAAAEKRARDNQAAFTAKAQEAKRLQETYQGIDPKLVQAWKAEKEKADLAKRPLWDRQHPAHESFKPLVARWKDYKAARARATTPEARQVLDDTVGKNFSAADVETLTAWEQHQAQFSERLAMDFHGTLAEEARQIAREEFQKLQQDAKTETETVGWMQDPENAPKVEKYRPAIISMLEKGYPWEAVQALVNQKWELDRLQSRAGNAEIATASARAKENALKAKASTTRDPGTTKLPVGDAWKEGVKWAKKHNLHPDHPRVLDYIDKLVKNQT